MLAVVFAPRADAAVYWSNDETQTLGRANLNGSALDNSWIDVSNGGNYYACSVAVGPGYVYWGSGTELAGTGGVGRASLSTGVPDHDFVETADTPCGVAVDSAHVYWTNWTIPGRIGRADIDGSDPEDDFINNAGVNTQHVSVDDEHVFWSNKGFGNCDSDPANGCTIGRANLDGDNGEPDFFAVGADQEQSGTATDGTYVYWGNGYDSIGRRKTDGSEPAEPNFIPNVDACAVAVYGSHIYWADYGGPSGGHIGRANLDGTGIDEEYIDTAGGTCGVAVDGLTISPPPPPPPPGPLPTECTNMTTLLVTCANLIGAPGVCVPGLELFPQCLHPTVPRTECYRGRGGAAALVCEPSRGGGLLVGSCANMGQALPECNVPTRDVPILCGGLFGCTLDGRPHATAAVCPRPSTTTIPACSLGSVRSSTASRPSGAVAAARRRPTRLTVTIGCPKVLAKPRCTGTIGVGSLRTGLLRTLSKQAQYSANIYRFGPPGLRGFAAPFEKAANAIAKQTLGGRKLPKAVNTAAVIARLGRSDAQTTSYAAALQRAVREYRRLAGRSKKKRGKPGASRGTTFKRFRLKSGRKRARVKVRLSARTLRSLRREAGKTGRVPIRVTVSYKATPRPVVRVMDLSLRVR